MSEELDNLKSMSLGDHLEELRGRLIMIILGIFVGLVVCLCFGKYLLQFLVIPFERAVEGSDADAFLTAIHPTEGFLMYIKASLIFGLLLTSPWVLWHVWSFVSAGLYKKEKKFVYAVVPISAILFISGAVFFMLVVAPMVMDFLVTFNEGLGFITSSFTLQNYVNMVLMLMLVFAMAFQMPIVVVFGERMGLVTIEQLTKGRKFVLLGLVIVSAMVTPPDVISQVALATPLYILYEGSILVCRFTRMRKNKQK
jgi:sec-independent protein translocase protein TatC